MTTTPYKYLNFAHEKRAIAVRGVASGLKRIFLGRGHEAASAAARARGATTLVSPWGAPPELARTGGKGFISKVKGFGRGTKHVLFGQPGRVETLRQRADQGGLFGRGGIVRSYMDPGQGWGHVGEGFRQAKGFKGKARALYDRGAVGGAVGAGFVAGYPAYGAYKSIKEGDPRHFTRELGSTLGFATLGPLGMPAMMAGSMGGYAAGGLGLKDPPVEFPSRPTQQTGHPRTQHLQPQSLRPHSQLQAQYNRRTHSSQQGFPSYSQVNPWF